MKILIIGYGNTLRGDDAVGVLAVEALESSGMPSHVELLTCHQLTHELAEELAFCDRVAFLDASVSGENPPGTIRQVKLEPHPVDPAAITHGFDAAALLALADTFYGQFPEAVLFTVTAGQFDLTESLSPEVARALPLLVNTVRDWALSAPH